MLDSARPSGHRLCLHCLAVLTEDDRLHYVYACQACVEDEHEAGLVARRDPGHPDAALAVDPPVLIETRRQSEPRRRLRAA